MFCLISTSCYKQNGTMSVFEIECEENFSSLISSLDHQPDLADTLYTEMYIALKAIEKDETLGDTVINRVQRLLKIDTIPENQRSYLEAASIIFSMRKDYPNFWEISKISWDTYPYDSFQRTSSYAMYFTQIEQNPDSAILYINKTINTAQNLLKSDADEDRITGCIGLAQMNILQGNDEDAKKIIAEFIRTEPTSENRIAAQSVLDDFESFKEDSFGSKLPYSH